MLHIADSFYTFMNIKVNKQKSILMINNTHHILDGHITLNFGSDRITFPNTLKINQLDF